MTVESAIEEGYARVIRHLAEQKAKYLEDVHQNRENYKDLQPEDVEIWFVESF